MNSMLEDPKQSNVEELATNAILAFRHGKIIDSQELYAKAAQIEEQLAKETPGSQIRTKSFLAINAINLWLSAKKWKEAATLSCHFLSIPDALVEQAKTEIRYLLERAWIEEQFAISFPNKEFTGFEVKLDGGLIQKGLAPAEVLRERQPILSTLILRTAEMELEIPFRKAGPSIISQAIKIYEAYAPAASYTLRLFIGVDNDILSSQNLRQLSSKQIVEKFLKIAENIQSPKNIDDYFGDNHYKRSFLRSFRDLAPDGKTIENIRIYNGIAHLGSDNFYEMTENYKNNLTSILTGTQQKQEIVETTGRLRAVNLRGNKPSVTVETSENGIFLFKLKKGEHDDTIGSKLNRLVKITGITKHKKDGSIENLLSDIELIETP